MNSVVFFMGRQRLVVQGLFIVEASLLHSDTPHLVRRLWRSDQTDVDTHTWQHTTLKNTDIYAPGGIRTRNPSKRAAADSRLGLRGHWERMCWVLWDNSNDADNVCDHVVLQRLIAAARTAVKCDRKSRSTGWSAYGGVSTKPVRIWNITYKITYFSIVPSKWNIFVLRLWSINEQQLLHLTGYSFVTSHWVGECLLAGQWGFPTEAGLLPST
jgi:hypothetical protein